MSGTGSEAGASVVLPPLPVRVFSAEGSRKVHATSECAALASLKAVPVEGVLPLERFSKSGSCAACCRVLVEVAQAFRSCRADGLLSDDSLVVLETVQYALPLPPVLGGFVGGVPEFVAQYVDMQERSFTASSFRRVPAWVAAWASRYSAACSLSYDRNRFRVHRSELLVSSDEVLRSAALLWQSSMYVSADERYAQYLVPAFEALVAEHSLELVQVAALLWRESFEEASLSRPVSPLASFGDALTAARLVLA